MSTPRKPRQDGKTCQDIPDCPRPYYADGCCRLHYDRKRKYGDPNHPPGKGGKPHNPPELAAAGISASQLNRWVNSGHLRAPLVGPNRRQWYPEEVAVAVRMAQLVKAGMTVKAAAVAARSSSGKAKLGPGVEVRVRDAS